MIFLDEARRDAVGLTFVLNELSADSPFGDILIRQAGVYGKDEKKKLTDEFYNISRVLSYIKTADNNLNDLRRTLMRFKNISNIMKKLKVNYLHEIELFEVKSFLLNIGKLAKAFSEMNKTARLRGIGFIDMDAALDILDPEKKRIAPFHLSELQSGALFAARKEKSDVEGLLRTEKSSSILEELKIRRLEIAAKEEDAETGLKIELSNRLRPYLPDFAENIKAAGKLDFTIQKALLAEKYGAVCPEIKEGGVEFLDMINPEVDDVLRKNNKSFTPVSISLSSGTTLLTGANMGGKSVAVKTAVLNVCLCHMGFFVFAAKASMPLFDGVCLISEDLQSISSGLSSFGAEIRCLDEIVKKSKSEYLFIALDELARGTNPEEGAIIVRAVAGYFDTLKSITVMTTHYDNIADGSFCHYQTSGLKNLDFRKLSGKAENSAGLISEYMDYRLIKVDGRADPPKDALNICRLLALDEDILAAVEEKYNKNIV